MKRELELYLHIPFCVRKCEYCDFLSGPADREQQRKYVEALCREIESCRDFKDYRVSTIFIGGGTPSLLAGKWMEEILESVRRVFSIEENAEISMEANPGTVDREKLEIYRKAGINRISFGCQSTENRELKILGRIHTWEMFLENFQLAREAGFSNINVDLMSGLPEQSVESWENSLRQIAKLDPEHISAYSLIIEEGTPFAERKLDLPGEEEERRMYERTHEILEEYGYHQYEISNYAKNGKECRHNLGYWNRTEYLGLGLGSASLVKETRFSNTEDFRKYLENSHDGAVIRENVQVLDAQSRMEEFIFLGLRLTDGISCREFENQFGTPMDAVYGDVIRKYSQMGFLEKRGDMLRFTREGISVSNPILADFLG